ncbi:hypothetical protein [Chryseobacterium hagamense]|uniref:Uncharacterized protein n=1 Tax=Chryseobacterium hagamense TaxID=395935 RepID=A0A511YJS3_9FLAO|nr:hypothetical protein [Chryseobacterium hagamense]GEN75445.1 hypothetical protein CHA01nite_11850 [Chryseobacterium hagamense]
MKKKSVIFIGITILAIIFAIKVFDRYNDVKKLTPLELQAKNK